VADQPHAAAFLGAAPVRHIVKLPVQVIPEAMGVHSLPLAMGKIFTTHLCGQLVENRVKFMEYSNWGIFAAV